MKFLIHNYYILSVIFWVKIFTESTINFWRKLGIGLRRAQLPEHLDDKVVVITGANRGIGLETARIIAERGATVILGCRNMQRGYEALKLIIDSIDPLYKNNVTLIHLDLLSFDSIYKFSDAVFNLTDRVDVLINNAGVMMCAEGKSMDGYETQLAGNYLGPFLLTNLLLTHLKRSKAGRIVNLSSIAHNVGIMHFDNINLVGNYTPQRAYGQSKLAVLLWGRELAKRLSESNIHVYSVHPGLIGTDLYTNTVNPFVGYCKRIFGSISFLNTVDGSQTTLYCAFDERVASESGHYYKNCKRDNNMTGRVNDQDSLRLWKLSMELCKLTDNNDNVEASYKIDDE